MKKRIVPASELSSKSLCAKDYVGGPAEPDTEVEEACQDICRQIDEGFDEFEPLDIKYEYDESSLTRCCGTQVFVPDEPDDGPVPQCASCGEQYPELVDPEPSDPVDPGDSCGGARPGSQGPRRGRGL